MDRAAFYAACRARNSGVFGTSLSQSQVNGIEAILDEGERRKTMLQRLAYMLATTYHETGRTMQPIVERGQRSYFDKYEPGTPIGRNLGNTQAGDGFRFRGRGFVQLTGRPNYVKAGRVVGEDLVGNPDKALEIGIAIEVMFSGMEAGWFTTRKLADYIGKPGCDYRNARRIINRMDCAEAIAGYARAFEAALRAGGY